MPSLRDLTPGWKRFEIKNGGWKWTSIGSSEWGDRRLEKTAGTQESIKRGY